VSADLAARAAAVRAHVDARRDEMLALLQRLVEIESYSEDRAGVNAVGAVVAERLEALGLAVRRLPEMDYGDHLLAEADGPGAPRVLLVGHLDTVFPTGTGWGFRVDGPRAYGPGVVDMKGGLVAALYALAALRATGPLPVAVRVLFNSDEEPGSPRSRHLLPDLARGVDYALDLELAEADGRIVVERKGVGIFTLTVRGRAAHAGQEPEQGVDANRELAYQVLAAADLADWAAGTTVNAGRIEGGTVPYAVSDWAQARLDVRVRDAAEQARLERALAALARANRVAGTTIEVAGGFHRPPMVELPGARRLRAAVEAAAAACGQRVRFGPSGAASDANNLVAAGVPTLDGMGGVGGRAHSHEEYLEIASLYDRAVLLATSLVALGAEPLDSSS